MCGNERAVQMSHQLVTKCGKNNIKRSYLPKSNDLFHLYSSSFSSSFGSILHLYSSSFSSSFGSILHLTFHKRQGEKDGTQLVAFGC